VALKQVFAVPKKGADYFSGRMLGLVIVLDKISLKAIFL
jgi:hypothetical protein